MLSEFLNPKLVQRLDPSPEINAFIRSVCQEVCAAVGLAETTLEQAFLARMRSGAVSTPEGVAFLHAVVVGAKQTVVGCCVMPKGLLLDYTNPPADIIFTLVGNSEMPWQHVRLLARLSRIACDADTRKRIKTPQTTTRYWPRFLKRTSVMDSAPNIERPARDERLLILIARTEESFDPLVTALLDANIQGATVLESRGLGTIIRSEMPIFAGLAALLPQSTGNRVVLSIATRAQIDDLMRFLSQLPIERRPIAVTLPLETVMGLGL